MDIRKIGVVGAFAAGAALALAPLAAADTEAPAPTDFDKLLSSEVSFMNSLFQFQATLAGVDAADITKGAPTPADPLSFDTVTQDVLKENHTFAQLLYGTNWETEMGSVPGSFSLFNGAVTQFTDANNVLLYALLNDGAQIDPTKVDVNDFLFGSATGIANGLAGDSVFEDFGNFFQAGVNDMLGYFAIDI